KIFGAQEKADDNHKMGHKDAGDIPNRPPVLCPGCPHRGVYYVLNKLKLRVTGDIGCYTLGALPPLQALDTTVCMGASIGTAFGMELGRGREFARNLVAVIGDSTFIHSGITGLIDMVYNGSTGTVIILDNSTTGMTGHQHHPATGFTLKGQPAPALDLEALVKALGVKRVVTVDSFALKELEDIIRAETKSEELSVIIAKRPCALLDKKNKGIPYHCETGACINCRLCLKLGCPAIEKTKDGIRINDTLCSGCGLCAQVCRRGAIKREE
ncbi:MAG: thiamine pyrophosphate-dependent enzyme, partial [Mahellales bacterium]